MIRIITAKNDHLDAIADMAFQLMKHHEEIDTLYDIVPEAREMWKTYASLKLSDENSRLSVAETEDKEVIGYALSTIVMRPLIYQVTKIGDVSDCFVLPQYRGRFVAVKLINDAIEWFKSKDIRYIGGQVDIRNERSAELWRKMGYSPYILKLIREYND